MLLLLVSFFLFITLSCYAVFAFPMAKRSRTQSRIQNYFALTPAAADLPPVEEKAGSFMERMVKPAWKNAKKTYQKKLNKEKADELETRLLQAGQPFGFSPIEFKLFQSLLTFLGILLAGGAALLFQTGFLKGMLLVLLTAVGGVVIPKMYLNSLIGKRKVAALKELPDMLDLLVISLEAGLGFDAALSKVTSKKQGVLSDEFRICLEEIRLGKTRKDALNGINGRLAFEELRGLITSIIQAEKLGIGMVTVLKVQTEDVREKRKQRAEEKAMKAPIKMLFPLVLFIFPTLFVILLSPAAIQFMEIM
ncbi:type II secretion system F family protein [Indiicoccus explosivorum]|uniref:type II secretion system F family protein n=1 Tax=Indiicoccus explosivorum TaxID=1917864 RepID=UPI0015880F22|nr:type II secretion system F family protein [Indiicoccus explosivorum]